MTNETLKPDCPKCGNGEVGVRWLPFKRMIRCHCFRCGAWWNVPPLDAAGETGGRDGE
jgi:putative component of membrane protein insertase Oxa1/YidC/SpoIIIJ protein YidD